MSDILKCPYCGGILEQTSIYNLNSYACSDLNCKGYFMTATKSMWQELIRTRKALEIAVDALKKYTDASGNWWYGYEFQGHYEDYAGEYADKALEQITALEQKDK